MQTYISDEVWEPDQDIIRNFSYNKRVGQYLLGRVVGEGSFAKVKESLHMNTAHKVAVKVISKKKAKEDAYVRRNLRREARVMQQLRHSNIIQLYEVIETDNSYYLVTELCRGGGLMDHICSKRHLPERESCRYMRQILSAVDYMHRAGVIHRDLKIENLLLDENKNIKIIDFGLSTIIKTTIDSEGNLHPQELCVTQCGSPAYAAPELLSNKKYGPKVDIWSIGVNMFAMLTGTLPFTVEPFHIKALFNKMVAGEMNPIPDFLSRESKDLIRKFLTADPDYRISLNAAMEHPWITDGGTRRIPAAQFPNRLRSTDLDDIVVQYMSRKLNFRMSDVIRCVINNIPSNITANYHFLRHKLQRYRAERGMFNSVVVDQIPLPHILYEHSDNSRNDTTSHSHRTRQDSECSEGEVIYNKHIQVPLLPDLATVYQKGKAKKQQMIDEKKEKIITYRENTIQIRTRDALTRESSSDSGITVEKLAGNQDTHTLPRQKSTNKHLPKKSNADPTSTVQRHDYLPKVTKQPMKPTDQHTNGNNIKNNPAIYTVVTNRHSLPIKPDLKNDAVITEKAKLVRHSENATGRMVTANKLPFLPSSVSSARETPVTVTIVHSDDKHHNAVKGQHTLHEISSSALTLLDVANLAAKEVQLQHEKREINKRTASNKLARLSSSIDDSNNIINDETYLPIIRTSAR